MRGRDTAQPREFAKPARTAKLRAALNPRTSPRLPTVDALRGIAALAVCWFHFTNAVAGFELPAVLRAIGAHGWLGVEIFFVISGFIIPHAMHAAGYRPADFGRFLLKRIVRIDPPYLAAIALILVQAWLIAATGMQSGMPADFSPMQVLLHLGYLNAFAGYSWLNPVFWTLAIEFQYYLVIALLFPLIATARIGRHALVFAGAALAAWLVPQEAFVCHYLFLFLLGIVTFQFRAGFLTRPAYLAALAVSTIGTALTLQWIAAATGLGTALLIAFVPGRRVGVLAFLGLISYPLYLLHIPVGTRILTASLRLHLGWVENLAVLAIALAATIGASWLMHRWIERPAQRWASAIRYRRAAIQPATRPAAEPATPGT